MVGVGCPMTRHSNRTSSPSVPSMSLSSCVNLGGTSPVAAADASTTSPSAAAATTQAGSVLPPGESFWLHASNSPYEVTTVRRYTNLFTVIIIISFLDPVLSSRVMKKITLCNTKKYRIQAGMNLTPPPPYNTDMRYCWINRLILALCEKYDVSTKPISRYFLVFFWFYTF